MGLGIMKLSKPATLSVVLALITACGSSANTADQPADSKAAPAPDPAQDSDGTQGTADAATPTGSDGSTGPDAGDAGEGPDAGDGGPDGGTTTADAGGTTDGGTGGTSDGGDGGGPVIVSNTQNWTNWNSTTTCPPWNQTPYSYKPPRTTYVGQMKCNAEATSFYDAYLGPSASPAAQASWDTYYSVCKQCVLSNWSDSVWGPVVKTPNGHFVLNQAGCYNLKDPAQVNCAYSSWNFSQCGAEACDGQVSQTSYQSCVTTSGFSLNGACGNASYGKGMADTVIFTANSPAWNSCYATGFADNEKQAAIRVILSFCY